MAEFDRPKPSGDERGDDLYDALAEGQELLREYGDKCEVDGDDERSGKADRAIMAIRDVLADMRRGDGPPAGEPDP